MMMMISRLRRKMMTCLRSCKERTPIRTILLVLMILLLLYYSNHHHRINDSITSLYNGTLDTIQRHSSVSKDADIITISSNNNNNNNVNNNDNVNNNNNDSNSNDNNNNIKEKILVTDNINLKNENDNEKNNEVKDINDNKEKDVDKKGDDNNNNNDNNNKSSNDVSDKPIAAINPPYPGILDQGEKLIILVGLPKSGTESMHTSFWTIHLKSAHWAINGNNKTLCTPYYPIESVSVGGNLTTHTTYSKIVKKDENLPCYVGVVIQRALSNGLPPLHWLTKEGYIVFAQMDALDVPHDIYIWPQFEMLDEFFKHYPKAHYIYTRREFTNSHIASLNAYNGLLERFQKAGLLSKFEGQSESNSMFENGKIFIEKTREITLNAFKARPDIKFLDICIDCEHANVSEKINTFLGIKDFNYEHKNTGRYDKFHTASPTPPHTKLS